MIWGIQGGVRGGATGGIGGGGDFVPTITMQQFREEFTLPTTQYITATAWFSLPTAPCSAAVY